MVTRFFCTAELSTDTLWNDWIWEGNLIDTKKPDTILQKDVIFPVITLVLSTILHAPVCIGQFIWGQFFYVCISAMTN